MYYLRIFLQYALTIILALSINFVLPRLAPGDPIHYLLGEDNLTAMSEGQIEAVRADYGLDKPLIVQYGYYLRNILHGDFGHSVSLGLSVSDIIKERLPWTLLLTGSALLFSAFFDSILGIITAWYRGGIIDLGIIVPVLLIGSLPSFWLAMMMIILFSTHLQWLPSFGAYPLGIQAWTGEWIHGVFLRLLMPALSLGLIQTALTLLIARSSMLYALSQDYITFARGKGLSEKRVFFRHAFRNALLPLYTNIMIGLGGLIGGALTIETVFSYPGLGSLIVNGVNSRDYPLLQGIFIFTTLSIICANILTDLFYPLIDPRTKRSA